MSRVLQFPAGRQFSKILNDYHEWHILSDTHLNILVMNRGDRGEITQEVIEKSYKELSDKLPQGRAVNVFDLHTHPDDGYPPLTKTDKRNIKYPSSNDLGYLVQIKRIGFFSKKNINIVGGGVITNSGIFIVKLNLKTPPEEYEQKIMDKHGEKVRQAREVVNNQMGNKGHDRPWLEDINTRNMKSHKKGYHSFEAEEPEFKHRIVSRTHKRTMRTRR